MEKLKNALNWVKEHVVLVLSGIIALMYLILKLKDSKMIGLEADASLNKTEQDTSAAEQQIKDLNTDIKKEEDLQKQVKKDEPTGTGDASFFNERYKK